jgi:tetratricopeptide (TPR) repeat protein
MSAKSSSAITVTVVLFAGILTAISARAQDAPASLLADQLKTQYRLAKMGTDSNIMEAGTVLVIQTDGILGVPLGSGDGCPATYKDGALHAPSADAKTHCGKDARKLNTGEKVYALKIEVDSKKDRVSLLIVECSSCNGAPPLASYKSQIVFQFPNGYLAAAEVGQIKDVISQVLTIDNGTNEAQRQARDGQSSPEVLTNDDIIKLAQAKLPDSVILAKIKSSNFDFDTSPDALIKLKRAGVSDSVLQAIVDASAQPPPSDSAENSPAAAPSKENDSAPECGNYDSCMKIAQALLESSQSSRALARFQEASQLDASKGDAWAGMGNAYLQMGQYDDAVSMWDKALQLGAILSIFVCHAKAACGDTGELLLSTKEISFVNKKGEKELGAAPSAVTSEVGTPRVWLGDGRIAAYYFQLRFSGKNYRFYYSPKSPQCNGNFLCSEPGLTQQKVFADYVHGALDRMAAGDFGSRPSKP